MRILWAPRFHPNQTKRGYACGTTTPRAGLSFGTEGRAACGVGSFTDDQALYPLSAIPDRQLTLVAAVTLGPGRASHIRPGSRYSYFKCPVSLREDYAQRQ